MGKTLLILTTSILSIGLCGCGAEKDVSDNTTLTSQESQASESEQSSDNEDSSEESTVIQLDTREYKYGDKYYLVLADANDEKNILQQYEFMIDIAFVDDFGF